MKLRILNNSLRIRFSQTELETLNEEGTIAAKIDFGGKDSTLRYRLSVEDTDELDADFTDNWIHVYVPRERFDALYSTELVGIENSLLLDEGGALHLLVEKDFKCLDKRVGEEDLFPNPKEGC